MEKVIKSFNVFLDNDRGTPSHGKGDELELELNSVNVDVDRNQYIRINLQSFAMHKVWPSVNDYNRKIIVVTKAGTANEKRSLVEIDDQNYASIEELVQNFRDKVQTVLAADSGLTVVDRPGSTLEPSTDDAAGTSDFIISFEFEFRNAGVKTPHGLGTIHIQLYETHGGRSNDAYSLLGGQRIREDGQTPTSDADSMEVKSEDSNQALKIMGFYPAQRFTESFVYVRLEGVNTNSLASSSLQGNSSRNNKLHHSTILGRIPIGDELINYQSSHDREFFVDLQQRHLNNLKLRLTDSHNNPLPQKSLQSTLGNLNFNAILRVDLLERYQLNDKHSGLTQQSMPKRFNTPIISYDGHD